MASAFENLVGINIVPLIKSARANPAWTASDAKLTGLSDAIAAIETGMRAPLWTGESLPPKMSAVSTFRSTDYKLWHTSRYLQGKLSNRGQPRAKTTAAQAAAVTTAGLKGAAQQTHYGRRTRSHGPAENICVTK